MRGGGERAEKERGEGEGKEKEIELQNLQERHDRESLLKWKDRYG